MPEYPAPQTVDRVQKGGERYYRIGDDEYVSVTTVTDTYPPKVKSIDSFEERVGAAEAKRIKERAGIRGTIVHHRILNPIAARRLELPYIPLKRLDAELVADVETCVSLWDDLGYKVHPPAYVEHPVASHEHGYSGTFDLLHDGTIVDLKTSKAAYDSFGLQVAAYVYAAREHPDLPDPDRGEVIVIHPDPEYNEDMTADIREYPPHEIDLLFEEFVDLLADFRQQAKLL